VTDVDRIVRTINDALPDLARTVIRERLDLSQPANQEFLAHPDGREQHQTDWHQWGIISHTRVFLRHFDDDIPAYLQEWGVWEAVDAALRKPIDDVTRWNLLRVSILLHDIGKFAARTWGNGRFHFARHETMSGDIIRSSLNLRRFGLTARQQAYVARTAEDHFVLGVLRKRAREQGQYDMSFIEGEAFRQTAEAIRREHPDDYLEIGVLFLGDSLSKTDPVDGPERAVDSYPINTAAARRYLKIVTEGGGTC
jgi:hypothetical protein